MTTLTATRTVMILDSAWDSDPEGYRRMTAVGTAPFTDNVRGEAIFSRTDEDGRRRTLSIEFGAWNDMGRPNEITVTVEPGDQLNRPPADIDPDQAEADMIAGFRGDTAAQQ